MCKLLTWAGDLLLCQVQVHRAATAICVQRTLQRRGTVLHLLLLLLLLLRLLLLLHLLLLLLLLLLLMLLLRLLLLLVCVRQQL
jgi:hypothetical protein